MTSRLQSAISVTALVLAVLGWTPLGEAAREAVFPAGSVGTEQLKANAVVSAKIRNGSVTGLDIQKRTVTGAHVKPGSLLAANFKAGQLPAGAKGDKGDKGDKGEKGEKGDRGATGATWISNYKVVQSAPVSLAANAFAIARVTCPTGTKPIGGGGHSSAGVAGIAYLSSSVPIDERQWQAAYKNTTANPATIWAYAVCATVAP